MCTAFALLLLPEDVSELVFSAAVFAFIVWCHLQCVKGLARLLEAQGGTASGALAGQGFNRSTSVPGQPQPLHGCVSLNGLDPSVVQVYVAVCPQKRAKSSSSVGLVLGLVVSDGRTHYMTHQKGCGWEGETTPKLRKRFNRKTEKRL